MAEMSAVMMRFAPVAVSTTVVASPLPRPHYTAEPPRMVPGSVLKQ
jgi:hypothetical protein